MNRINTKEDWSHGQTPKCCACKFFGNLLESEEEKQYEKSGYCYNIPKRGYAVSPKAVKEGKEAVWHMQAACFRYEYRGEDMLVLEAQNEMS